MYLQGVEGSSFGIKERTVRLPFTTNPEERKSHLSFVKKQFLNFIHGARVKNIEVFVTANIVLTPPTQKEFR